jgi:hypothetical protein
VRAVKFIIEAASVTDRMASLVPTPERRDGGPAILASNHHGGVPALEVQFCHIHR